MSLGSEVLQASDRDIIFTGDSSNDEREDLPNSSTLVSYESSEDSDEDFEYTFPSKKVKMQRMAEKKVKREANCRNKYASMQLDPFTNRDLKYFVDLIEEYKYKFDLIYDDDYLFLLSILPTLLNLEPHEKFRICRGINEILVSEANNIIEHFRGTFWSRGDNYTSRFFMQTKHSIPLGRSVQYRKEARLLLQVQKKLEYFESYRDDQYYSNPGLDNDEIFFYLMSNLPIIGMYDPSQKFVIRHAINEKFIQEINNDVPVSNQSEPPTTPEYHATDKYLQSDEEDNNKMELRTLIHRTVKIMDHYRIKPYELDTDETYVFLMRILRVVKYLKLQPKLHLFDGINSLLIDETTSYEASVSEGGNSSNPQNETNQSQPPITDEAQECGEISERMRLLEEKFQIIEKRIKNSEFSMDLRKDGDYLFLISIYSTIKKLSQLQKPRLFNEILELLNDVTRFKHCLFQ
ncbi:hypothetical protein LSTR_LSTR012521 [Laodelphax striatellus]|uniref:BESS domain-containing protein n=1 Tax=Laodelphax striatellus TaxID=195883 RepID=A0A482XKK5_LAOST|nr:hypothetical protein LSTR_LSTR012521 [Laodelphax striatellus]